MRLGDENPEPGSLKHSLREHPLRNQPAGLYPFRDVIKQPPFGEAVRASGG
ncbi:hypothetical protein [Paenibacillus jilunlii]|uniref:hypothetical protein n=1 Tax=Paenibacillus jilunlii TaxID=682956 RepID=UPI000A7F384E|nr:hypothetical protein [Paenibacillus jilunlii]